MTYLLKEYGLLVAMSMAVLATWYVRSQKQGFPHGMRNELDRALSTTLGADKKATPGLHSIRVEDAVVIHLSRGPLWCPAKPDIHLGDSINVLEPSTQAGIKWLGQPLVAHSVGRARHSVKDVSQPTCRDRRTASDSTPDYSHLGL